MVRTMQVCGLGLAVALVAGCSATGAAWETVRIGKNLAEKDSHLKLYLDGYAAKQNKLKKGYFGYASFEIKDPVSTSPTFRYDFIDPSKFGRITSTNLSIYQEFEADFSHQAEFTVTPTASGGEHQMKPATDYPLGSAGSGFRCINFEQQNVPGVTLKPGLKYMLVFTVAGDRSESVQMLFETK